MDEHRYTNKIKIEHQWPGRIAWGRQEGKNLKSVYVDKLLMLQAGDPGVE